MKLKTNLGFILSFVILLLMYFTFSEYKAIKAYPVNAWTDTNSADCAVVLTGGSGRVQEGMSLLSQNRIKKLIISGVNPYSNLRQIFPALVFYGDISENDIILEKKSKTTFGNAQQSLALVGALNCQSIILVTSRLHMHRSAQVFRQVFGPDFHIIPRAIYNHYEENSLRDFIVELAKSVFYSIWAY